MYESINTFTMLGGMNVVGCTDVTSKHPNRQGVMGNLVTSVCLGGVMVITLAQNARNVGSIAPVGPVFPIFISPTTHVSCQYRLQRHVFARK